MNIVLIGYRACGKTAVGRLLSERLDWPFLDTDVLIEQRCGMTIRDIFADRAEEAFREMERRVIAEVAQLDKHILSTGGGAVLNEDNARALKQRGLLIWLTASPETIWQRILADRPRLASRPDFDRARGFHDIQSTIEQREPSYRRWADLIIDTDERSPDRIAEEIFMLVESRLAESSTTDAEPTSDRGSCGQ